MSLAETEPQEATPPDLASLLQLTAGAYLGQALSVAARLGIADLLDNGPQSIAAIATATGAHAPFLHRLMRALTTRRVFAELPDGRFALTPIAAGLCSKVQGNLRSYAVWMGEDWHLNAVSALEHTVRTGEPAFAHAHGMPLYAYLAEHPRAGSVFDAAITSRAHQENSAIVAAFEWPVGTIVDVGGGQGTLLAAILRAQTQARGIVFELPHVAAAASAFIAAEGLADRCTAIAGDAFEHVPSGGMLYLMRRVLHGQDDTRCSRILRNCRAAMMSGSRLLVIEHVLAPGDDGSWGRILDLQMLMLSANGRERTQAEFSQLLSEAGFVLERIVPTPTAASMIEGSPV
jgi:hypothetical protein